MNDHSQWTIAILGIMVVLLGCLGCAVTKSSSDPWTTHYVGSPDDVWTAIHIALIDLVWIGEDLGTHKYTSDFGSQTVSYAGMHYESLTDSSGAIKEGAIRDDFPPNMPMGSDDTQYPINHGTRTNGGMAVLFFDSHVEFRTNTEIDLERGLGDPGSGNRQNKLLWQLNN